MTSATNKVWFITGASRGFGALMTKDALARGDSVIATARNPQQIIEAVGDHPQLLAVKLDVTDEAGAIAAAQTGIERFGRVDILVNNAGYGLLGAVEEASATEVQAQFNTNVFGLLHVTRAIAPYMRAAGSGRIFNISSVGGYASYPGWGIYAATKFAVEALSESLAYELAPLGIQVTVVEPGFFRTDFLDSTSLASTAKRIEQYSDTVGEMRSFMAAANHQQPGDPLKFSKVMMLLADAEKAPVRLPLGSDTIAKIHEKNRFVESEMATWIDIAKSTDHDDTIPA